MSADYRKAWTWRHAILTSRLPATTRHVLLTISCHMNDVGEGCFPSTRDLAAETGLSERAVCEHIKRGAAAGWIEIFQHGFAGRRWKRNEYRPKWPASDAEEVAKSEGTDAGSVPEALTEDQHLEQGTDGASVEGTDPHDIEALTQDQRVYKTSQVSSHSLSKRERASETNPVSKFEPILTELAEQHPEAVEHLLRPMVETLAVQHALPRRLLSECARIVAGQPVAMMHAVFERLVATRSKIIAPANIADALEHCRLMAREATSGRAFVTVHRLAQPQQWAAWRRWADETLEDAAATRADRTVARVIAEAREQIVVPHAFPKLGTVTDAAERPTESPALPGATGRGAQR